MFWVSENLGPLRYFYGREKFINIINNSERNFGPFPFFQFSKYNLWTISAQNGETHNILLPINSLP